MHVLFNTSWILGIYIRIDNFWRNNSQIKGKTKGFKSGAFLEDLQYSCSIPTNGVTGQYYLTGKRDSLTTFRTFIPI